VPANPDLVSLARLAAAKHSLDPAIVCAIVEQESSWDTHAIRYEPAFRTRYVSPLGLPATEEVARSISWGLMQVMGQVARENGFSGKSLAELCDPAAGLEIGCTIFVSKLSTAAGDVTHALKRWNGGANSDYAAQVLARVSKYR
jgi:soluble lytic murein transglycosylase-like protein